MLTVWGRQSSSNVQAVVWCIEELGLTYKRIDAGYKYGIVDSREYLEMNPNGTVPTLQDNQKPPIWESGAILRYLSAAYADTPFWPKDLDARTGIDMWAEWSKLNVASKFTSPIFWQAVRTPAERRDQAALDLAVQNFEKNLAIADDQLRKSQYIASDDFSMADIQFGHVLYRYYDIAVDRSSKLENVRRYYEVLTSRQAYQDHVMVSYKELEGSM